MAKAKETEITYSVTTSTGHTFKLAPMLPLLYRQLAQDLARKYPEPKIPVKMVTTLEHPEGEEWQNADDPDYTAALAQHRELMGNKMLDALIIMGLEVEVDLAWLRRMKFLSIEVGETPEEQAVAYVRMAAIGGPQDVETITNAVLRRITVTEGAVAEAAARFPS